MSRVRRRVLGGAACSRNEREKFGGTKVDLPSPDDIAAIFSQPFFVSFWPLIAGAVIMFAAIFAGYGRATIPVGILTAFFQAWHSGLFA